jgi:hypothetical protein
MMKKRLLVILVFFCFTITAVVHAQQSVLINFGSNGCAGSTLPGFSLIKNPLSAVPQMLANCSMAAQTANIFSVFVAYNPLNNKTYVADNRDGLQTKIWVLDIGLPGNINCPAAIPVSPTYSYSYISNNFEFDNNGDLWSLSAYNPTTGTCQMDKFDVNTGNVINTRVLQFPVGNFPTTIQSGDLAILPNGRMFAVLGNGICRLYEIKNYNSSAPASADFLRLMPRDCFGIAYLNGLLEVTGTNLAGSCYYYDYNIATGVLGSEKVFQNNQTPIDNSSFTPAIGCTKRLLSASLVNSNTADLVYEVYAENMGNAVLSNVNITDNLAATFGNGNVLSASASFAPGANVPGLLKNPAYNGTTQTKLLLNNQLLPNRILQRQDYFVKMTIQCRVTNLAPGTIYLNSAIVQAEVGAANTASLIAVADSSNNGDSTRMDPNKNGNPSDAGENEPTPFSLNILPVKFLHTAANFTNSRTVQVSWQVAIPVNNARYFEVEWSTDGIQFRPLGRVDIINNNQSAYQYLHSQVSLGRLYYRIKQVDADGALVYSRLMLLNSRATQPYVQLYPNPADQFIAINISGTTALSSVRLTNAAGQLVWHKSLLPGNSTIPSANLPAGVYHLHWLNQQNAGVSRIVIQH